MKAVIILTTFFLMFNNAIFGQAKIDTSKLSEEQKKIYDRLINEIYGYNQCQDTLKECLQKNSSDISVNKAVSMIIRLLLRGKDENFIKKAIQNRAISLFGPKEKIDVSGIIPFGQKKGVKPIVSIVEYGDFECPYCAAIAPSLHKIVKKYGGKVVLYFKHFPVKSHKKAIPASISAIAVERQGKFWNYYFMLYKNREHLDEEDLDRYAKSLGIDFNKYLLDKKDKAIINRIKKEKLEGLNLGVNSTPTFFINGIRYMGLKNGEEFSDFIEEFLQLVEQGVIK